MSTMTAVRSTPSLSIPPTQNTAPVFEYRCLYSQDLRKKKKTWHDGYLKYHTFNKRLVVWDDQRNLIGDMHWREDNDLQEGAELSLDRGTLVEVGEQIGSTVTDLAPLREAVTQNHTNSLANRPILKPAYSSTLQSTTSRSQWQPKPLSAILGSSQGPIGRAKLPTKSPFEQRQERNPIATNALDRPTKRLRLAEDVKDTQQCTTAPRSTDIQDVVPQSLDNALTDIKKDHRNASRKGKRAAQDALELASDHETSTTAKSKPPLREVRARGPEHTRKIRPLNRPMRSENIEQETSQHADIRFDHVSTNDRLGGTAGRDRSGHGAVGSNKPSLTKLRFGKSRPRRKLMYKALLAGPCDSPPQTFNHSHYDGGQAATTVKERRENRASRYSDLSDMFSDISSDASSRRTGSAQPLKKTVDFAHSESAHLQTILIESSPETGPSLHSPTPEQPQLSNCPNWFGVSDAADNQIEVGPDSSLGRRVDSISPKFDRMPGPAARRSVQGDLRILDESAPAMSTTDIKLDTVENAEKKGDTSICRPSSYAPAVSQDSSPITSRLALLDQQLHARLPEIASQKPVQQSPTLQRSPLLQRTPQPKPFRRVLSANDSPVIVEDVAGPASPMLAPAPQDNGTRRPLQAQEGNVQRTSTRLTKLQKSKSLSEVIQQTTTTATIVVPDLPGVEEEPEDDDMGAWSKHEAWDLFSWWPQDREKPNFGPLEVEE